MLILCCIDVGEVPINDETKLNKLNVKSNIGNLKLAGFKCSHFVSIALNKKTGKRNDAIIAEYINESGSETIIDNTRPNPKKYGNLDSINFNLVFKFHDINDHLKLNTKNDNK